jgi:hypothetical protein
MSPRVFNSEITPAAHGGDPSRVTYQIVPQSPPLEARELEDAGSAVEIVIIWGELSVLHVAHLTPPRAFYLGAAPDTDFVIGEECLGSSRLPLVLESQGDLCVVFGRDANADIELDGALITLEELAEQDRLRPVPDTAGARSFPLQRGISVRIALGDFTFIVRSVPPAQRIATVRPTEPVWRRSRWTIASAAAHLGLLGLCYFLPPSSSALSMDSLDTDSRLVKYAIDARESPPEEVPTWLAGGAASGGGDRAADDDGEAGERDKPKTHHKLAVASATAQPSTSREVTVKTAASAGIIGILRASVTGASTSPFDRARALSVDPEDVLGKLFGDVYGVSGGKGGLSMIGTGRGGGGNAVGSIGMGGIGTRGRGDGDGDGYGLGEGVGSYRRRSERVPRIRQGVPDLHGSLSKELIRREIGRHINEVRFCYESQLISQPDLQGRVAIKFIIAPTGAVMNAVVDQTDVGSPKVESCIAAAVRRMSFPAPEGGGLVIVTYPFLLSQAGQ